MKKMTTELDVIKSCNEGNNEFFVLLNYGLRSSKTIMHNEDGFYVYHDAYNMEEEVVSLADSSISDALEMGALYSY